MRFKSRKCVKIRLRPGFWGSLQRSPDPLVGFRGGVGKGRETKEGGKGRKGGREGKEGQTGSEQKFWLWPCDPLPLPLGFVMELLCSKTIYFLWQWYDITITSAGDSSLSVLVTSIMSKSCQSSDTRLVLLFQLLLHELLHVVSLNMWHKCNEKPKYLSWLMEVESVYQHCRLSIYLTKVSNYQHFEFVPGSPWEHAVSKSLTQKGCSLEVGWYGSPHNHHSISNLFWQHTVPSQEHCRPSVLDSWLGDRKGIWHSGL